ncbi:protein FAM236B isoform X2 [Mus caroli]|uniref:Protein FAM236B isoform X2 n=1 Tax=Mus caroli TaxID=10089 RepID=A0A6P7QVX6_MUSCR|nr:protein FAM236B isoform X2 [Mus caroli]
MNLVPYFPPSGQNVKNLIHYTQDSVTFAHTMENSSSDPREAREPAPQTRSWRGRFQRALARLYKFFRRGHRTTQG